MTPHSYKTFATTLVALSLSVGCGGSGTSSDGSPLGGSTHNSITDGASSSGNTASGGGTTQNPPEGGLGNGAAASGGATASGGSSSGGSGTGGAPPAPKTRVVGYLPNWYGSYESWAGKIDFGKLTHVNLAFALADNNGKLGLAPSSEIDAFVSAAHDAGVRVFPSLCGGGGDSKITPYYQADKVDAFVENIISFAEAHNMDGVDVDVEAPNKMGSTYDTFIKKLIEKAHSKGLEVTAAVAQWMQWGMSDATLKSFDFVTIMSYDNTGTWTDAGAHSSYAQAVEALDFYSAKGVSKDRLVLGVPFYGYCWGNCNGKGDQYILYKDILGRYSWADTVDWIDQNGSQYSFNGTSTIQKKTALALDYGGIMIWELGGDVETSDQRSLLRAIDEAAP